MTNKIKSREELENLLKELRSKHKIIVTTNGSFDILHSAHINLLEKAKQEGDILIVLLNSDLSIKSNKGENRPIIPQDERAKILSAIEYVDYVVIFDDIKPLDLLEKIKPNIHIKGGTYDPERMREEKELVDLWDGRYINFELEEGYSTTNIIEKIKAIYTKD